MKASSASSENGSPAVPNPRASLRILSKARSDAAGSPAAFPCSDAKVQCLSLCTAGQNVFLSLHLS